MKVSPQLPERVLSLYPSIECKYSDFRSLAVCSLQVCVLTRSATFNLPFFLNPRNYGVMLGLYLTKAVSRFLVVHTLLKFVTL